MLVITAGAEQPRLWPPEPARLPHELAVRAERRRHRVGGRLLRARAEIFFFSGRAAAAVQTKAALG